VTATRLAIACALAACGTDIAPSCPVPDFAAGAPAQARASDVQQIFAHSCALGGCHLHDPGAGGLVLDVSSTAWMGAIVGVRAHENPAMDLVSAGDPDRSWLVRKVFGDTCGASCDPALGCGAQMPFGAPLADADRATIAAWIAAGAVGD